MNLFIGNFIEVLEVYNGAIGVDTVISETGKVDESIVRYCEENKIILYLVKSDKHLHELTVSLGEYDLCIVASFGLLLKSEFLDKVKWTVNIHPGNLKTCRGRHPLPFAIYKGLPLMTLTAHLIVDEKIDKGPVVATLSLPIDYEKSYLYNDRKLRASLSAITNIIVTQFRDESRILSGDIDLSDAPYNVRLSNEALSELMNAKSLKKYKEKTEKKYRV